MGDTFRDKWAILDRALSRHGVRVWALAALQDIRNWTDDSLTPLVASNASVDQDAILDLIRESMQELIQELMQETKNEIFPIESVAGKPGGPRKRRRSSGRGAPRKRKSAEAESVDGSDEGSHDSR
jgi:hypothetical protein